MTKTVGPEFYLCEIIDFYKNIITTLHCVIGILLALSFAYVYFSSKRQAEEMACEALESESFKIILKEKIREKFAENLGESDIASIFEDFENIGERIAFLEDQINVHSYDEINNEESGEAS